MRTILALCGILAVFEFGVYGAEAAPGGGERFRAEARGIGSVEGTLRLLGSGNTASLMTFASEEKYSTDEILSQRWHPVRLPGCLGVLWVSYLWGAGVHQAMESQTLTERERALGRFVASAAAPVGVMVDFWKSAIPTGRQTVSVSVANDGPAPWSGTVRLSLIRAGENLFKMGALFEPPETQAEIDQRTVHQWKQDFHKAPVSQQGEAVFDVVIPEAGNYHFMAEITGLDGKPVRSWRDFVSTGDPVGVPSPAARTSNKPRHSHSVAFPRPAGPEWSWGLPVY